MKRYLAASLLLAALATPAFAATAEHYAVIDTVGNCAVIDTKPSPYDVSGLKILGQKSGYSNMGSAQKALKSDGTLCKGTVERA
jgi:hypothetical protein